MDALTASSPLAVCFTVVLLIPTLSHLEIMTETQTPPDPNELKRLRALVADYEAKLTDAAALVAHVRHEINNPLAALLGQVQLMLREDPDGKVRRRAEIIEQLAIRIKETVAELRDVQTPVAAVNRAEE
jgi:signal transduction histidine kinase